MSTRAIYAFLLAPIALLLVPPPVHGQQTDTTQLPEIAPREIEIRGEREIALPSLERQPLTGFASPPSMPSVPATHQPYVGSYKHPLDALPESLPVPETVSQPMQTTADPAKGFLEGGTGRYFSRFFEGRVGVPLSPAEHLSIHGAYTGMEDDPNDDVAEASVRLESDQDILLLNAGLHGAVQRYDLFGATPVTGVSSSPPAREGFSGGGSIEIQNKGSVPARAALRYEGAQYSSALDLNADDRVFSQQQVELLGSVSAPLPYRPHLDATFRRSWLGGDPEDDTAFDLDATGTASFSPTPSTSVEVGATVLAFETPAAPTTPALGTADKTFVAPTIRAEWRFADNARLYLRNHPRLGDTSLDQLYTTNPYARHAPSLRPTLETTNIDAGVTLSRGFMRIVAEGGYRYAPTYRFFTLPQTPFVPQGDFTPLYQVEYESARIVEGRGQVALQGIDGVQASLGLSVRDGTLKSPDRTIPNFATVTADAMVAVSFAGGDGFVEAHGRFEGPRDAGLGTSPPRLDSYFSADLEGSYAVRADTEIVARVRNLSFEAPELWEAYPRPPAQISLGLRLTW